MHWLFKPVGCRYKWGISLCIARCLCPVLMTYWSQILTMHFTLYIYFLCIGHRYYETSHSIYLDFLQYWWPICRWYKQGISLYITWFLTVSMTCWSQVLTRHLTIYNLISSSIDVCWLQVLTRHLTLCNLITSSIDELLAASINKASHSI